MDKNTGPKTRRKKSIVNTMKRHPNISLDYVIPIQELRKIDLNSKALIISLKICKVLKLPILSKKKIEIMHCIPDKTYIRIARKILTL